jgi:hypothetical protein
VSSEAKCHATAVKSALPVDSRCLAAAEARFNDAFDAAELITPCLTTMDKTGIAAMADAVVAQVVADLAPGSASGVCPAKKIAAAGTVRQAGAVSSEGLATGAAVSVSCLAGRAGALRGFDRAERRGAPRRRTGQGGPGINVNLAFNDLLTALQIPQ